MKNIHVRTQAHPRQPAPGATPRRRRARFSRGAVLLMLLLSLSLVWLLFVLAALVFA